MLSSCLCTNDLRNDGKTRLTCSQFHKARKNSTNLNLTLSRKFYACVTLFYCPQYLFYFWNSRFSLIQKFGSVLKIKVIHSFRCAKALNHIVYVEIFPSYARITVLVVRPRSLWHQILRLQFFLFLSQIYCWNIFFFC